MTPQRRYRRPNLRFFPCLVSLQFPEPKDAVSPLLLCFDRPKLYGLQPLSRRPVETRQER